MFGFRSVVFLLLCSFLRQSFAESCVCVIDLHIWMCHMRQSYRFECKSTVYMPHRWIHDSLQNKSSKLSSVFVYPFPRSRSHQIGCVVFVHLRSVLVFVSKLPVIRMLNLFVWLVEFVSGDKYVYPVGSSFLWCEFLPGCLKLSWSFHRKNIHAVF